MSEKHLRRTKPISEKFWSKVTKGDSCWLWRGMTKSGYGAIDARRISGVFFYAHRVSWEIHFGPVPEGLHVLHTCDTPLCVNPKHLFLGTQRDNNNDKVAKGRQAKGEIFPYARLTERDVKHVRIQYAGGGITMQKLADELDTDTGHISMIVNRKMWKHVH